MPQPHLLKLLGHALPVLLKLADPVERTRRIGDVASKTTTVDEAVRRQVIAARLPANDWPHRVLKIVAVDIATGQPRIFERGSGVCLVDAVAASCAVPGIWPPVSIGQSRYMDGGVRSSDNADLAAGCGTVVVISPLGANGMNLPGSAKLSEQVEALQRGGARVLTIEPDAAARKAIGSNPLSPETRAPAATCGRAQGHDLAPSVVHFMRSQASNKMSGLDGPGFAPPAKPSAGLLDTKPLGRLT